MSREQDVEIVRAHFEATNRRDWATVMAGYDEDVVLVVHASAGPDAGTFIGRKAVGDWFGTWLRAFGDDYRFTIERAEKIGNRVLIVARHHGRGRASGINVEQTFANAYGLREGKIVSVGIYGSPNEALEDLRHQ